MTKDVIEPLITQHSVTFNSAFIPSWQCVDHVIAGFSVSFNKPTDKERLKIEQTPKLLSSIINGSGYPVSRPHLLTTHTHTAITQPSMH